MGIVSRISDVEEGEPNSIEVSDFSSIFRDSNEFLEEFEGLNLGLSLAHGILTTTLGSTTPTFRTAGWTAQTRDESALFLGPGVSSVLISGKLKDKNSSNYKMTLNQIISC